MFALALSVTLLVAPEPDDPLSPAIKDLQGEWRAVSVEEKGDAWTNKEEIAEVVIEISADTLVYKRNKPHEKFRISLDPKGKPASIDLRLVAKDADPKKLVPGIYSLEKGRLTLCLPTEFTPATDRPAEFKTTPPSKGTLILVMEQIKK